MSGKEFKGYVQAAIGGIVLIAAVVLAALQWAHYADTTIYGYELRIRTIWLMFWSALGGGVVWWTARLLLIGFRNIHQKPPSPPQNTPPLKKD